MYQKRCLSDLSYESRLVEFGLLKICDLFNFLRLVFCFKLINGIGPFSFLQFFEPSKVNEFRSLHFTSHTNVFLQFCFCFLPKVIE